MWLAYGLVVYITSNWLLCEMYRNSCINNDETIDTKRVWLWLVLGLPFLIIGIPLTFLGYKVK